MSAQHDARQLSHSQSPSSTITRQTSMELPDRFKLDEEDIVDEGQKEREELAARQAGNMPFMHQSIFGMIAAAQSGSNVPPMLVEGGSESEEETDMRAVKHKAVERESRSSATRHSKRRSEDRTLRTTSTRAQASLDAAGPELGPEASPFSDSRRAETSDAPVMSQMLEARAAANIESSDTITSTAATEAGRTSLDPNMAPQKSPVSLANALKDIFQFDETEEVVAEYPCWYLQSVLLEGYMYVTKQHICFYAYLQKRSNVTIKSGLLSKRGPRNPQYNRYHFVLKGDVLTYYTSSSNRYFPRGTIDLRYGISAELLPDNDKDKEHNGFSVTTDKSTYYFRADSAPSAREWVKQLQKVIFRSRNDGDSVKILIPIDNVVDIEENALVDFAETVKLRIVDNDETFAVDEYFFSFFGSGKDAVDVLRRMSKNTSAQKALSGHLASSTPTLLCQSRYTRNCEVSTPNLANTHAKAGEDTRSSPRRAFSPRSPFVGGDYSRSGSGVRRTGEERRRNSRSLGQIQTDKSQDPALSQSARRNSLDSSVTNSEQASQSATIDSLSATDASGSQILSESVIFHEPTIRNRSSSQNNDSPQRDQTLMQDSPSTDSSPRLKPVRVSPPKRTQTAQDWPSRLKPTRRPTTISDQTIDEEAGRLRHSDSSTLGGLMRAGTMPIKQASGIADYLKTHGKKAATLLSSSPMEYYDKFSGMISGGKKHYSEGDGLSTEDHVRDPDEEEDVAEAERRFRAHFALPQSERLVAAFFGYLQRVLPVYGKIYIGSTKLCFRSLLLGTRTKVVIPYRDILNVDKEKGFRFGYSGMVVTIRGHEEVFFEFGSAGLRDDCTITVLRTLNTATSPDESLVMTDDEKQNSDAAAAENSLLQAARRGNSAEQDIKLPRDIHMTESDTPTIVFDDPAASVLDFKPKESLHITCLTIGSRGDVQPYIALCKGLLAEGHRPKIATHAEFKDWVEKHGIEFAPVGGDPAELMRICVENGMFTPSFLKEANSKFRGFVKTLLYTSWEACQGSDVLIESPSAMGGIHIAEALQIPYFRAFTMLWTRTRAYPHAFAVPNHKMGGAYNYMTYILFDTIFWQASASMVNRWRQKALGLRPTNMDKLQPNKVPFLYNFSPSVVVPPLDFSEWIRVTGYWFLDEASTFTPKPSLVEFIARARADKQKLVYIGFGSVVVADPKALTLAIVAAVKKADVRCILSKGWSDRLGAKSAKVSEVPLPDCIYQIDAAPHDWLFKQVDAAVHHGGCGTTGASLRAGIPTIIRPFFGDQYFFGSRVEDLGVGIQIGEVTEMVLGRALWIACHDRRMIDKARVLGEQIRAENGVATAIKAIYRDMEYARSLIKRPDLLSTDSSNTATTDTAITATNNEESGRREVGGDGEEEEEEEEEAEEWTLVENDSDEGLDALMRGNQVQQGMSANLRMKARAGFGVGLPLRGRRGE